MKNLKVPLLSSVAASGRTPSFMWDGVYMSSAASSSKVLMRSANAALSFTMFKGDGSFCSCFLYPVTSFEDLGLVENKSTKQAFKTTFSTNYKGIDNSKSTICPKITYQHILEIFIFVRNVLRYTSS